MGSRFGVFLAELKRRKVTRVAVMYVVVGLGAIEAADLILPAFALPDWTYRAVVAVTLAGFPVALALAWALDLTTRGLEVTPPRNREEVATALPKRRLAEIFLLFLAASFLAVYGFSSLLDRPVRMAVGPESATKVAVFPFSPSGEEVGHWSEGAADLLATALDGAGGITVADPWALWQELRPQRSARALTPDRAEATELARQAGAGRYVLGRVTGSGQRVDLILRLYDLRRQEPLRTLQFAGLETELAQVTRRAAIQILAQLLEDTESRDLADFQVTSSRSPQALKAYLAAREAMRRGLVDSAEVAIQRSLEEDSLFAPALVSAIEIRSWGAMLRGGGYRFMPLAQRAEALKEDLGDRDRLRLEAAVASVRTDGPTAAAAARQILARDETDVWAWRHLTYYDQVYGWQYGTDPWQAVERAERALDLDPEHVPTVATRARLAVLRADTADARAQLHRLQPLDTTLALVRGVLHGVRAFLADEAGFQAMMPALQAEPMTSFGLALESLRASRPRRALALVRARLDRGDPGERMGLLMEEVRLLLAMGRLSRVDSILETVAGSPWIRNQLQTPLVAGALSGFVPAEAAQDAGREMHQRLPADSALAWFRDVPVWWTGWAIGAFQATHGDPTVAHRWQEAMTTLPAGGTSRDYRGALVQDMEARLSARNGDHARALTQAREAFDLWTIHTETYTGHHPEPQIRYLLATQLRRQARPDSADAILRSLVPPVVVHGSLTLMAWTDLAELALERGDGAEARRLLGRVERFLQDADPAMEPFLDRVRGLRERAG